MADVIDLFPKKTKTQQKRDTKTALDANNRARMVADAIKNVCHAMGYNKISESTLDLALEKLEQEGFIV